MYFNSKNVFNTIMLQVTPHILAIQYHMATYRNSINITKRTSHGILDWPIIGAEQSGIMHIFANLYSGTPTAVHWKVKFLYYQQYINFILHSAQ